MTGPVAVRREALSTLRALAGAAYPEEGCGVLVGRPATGAIRVDAVTSGTNLRRDRARDRYELDPGDIVRAEREARAAGLDVVGFWHSHPDGVAIPSAFDRERAWPEWVYVVVATGPEGTRDLRAWEMAGDAARELAVESR